MSRRFKTPVKGVEYNLIADKKCTTRGHQGVVIEFNVERFGIFVCIKDCGDCVRQIVNAINRCRSAAQLDYLLTKLKRDHYGNTSGKGSEHQNTLLSV